MKRGFILAMCCLIWFPTVPALAADAVQRAGDVTQIALPVTAYLLTRHRHDNEGRHMFFQSFFSSMALTFALKYSIDDNRPTGTDQNSFVSAHTAAAFSGSAFMQRRYGWKWGLPSYLAASFVGWSRYHAKLHDTDDIFRGAAIGIIGAYWFTRPIGHHALLYPIVTPDTVGIGLRAQW